MARASVSNVFEQPNRSGDNKLIVGGSMSTGLSDLKTRYFILPIGDVSTAGSVWVVPGVTGTVIKILNVIDAAITAADAGLTFEINGTPITDGDITIANAGSAAGDVDQSTPSAANIITVTDAIEVVKDGLSTTTSNGVVTFEILLS